MGRGGTGAQRRARARRFVVHRSSRSIRPPRWPGSASSRADSTRRRTFSRRRRTASPSCLPLSEVHLRRGDPALAAAVARRGINEMVGDATRRLPLMLVLVESLIAEGDLDGATETVAQVEALARPSDPAAFAAERALCRGRLDVGRDDLTAAVAAVREGPGLDAGRLRATHRRDPPDRAGGGPRSRRSHDLRRATGARRPCAVRTPLRGRVAGTGRGSAPRPRRHPAGPSAGDPAGILADLTGRERDVLELGLPWRDERGDRTGAVHLAQDRGAPRRSDPDEARGPVADRSRRHGRRHVRGDPPRSGIGVRFGESPDVVGGPAVQTVIPPPCTTRRSSTRRRVGHDAHRYPDREPDRRAGGARRRRLRSRDAGGRDRSRRLPHLDLHPVRLPRGVHVQPVPGPRRRAVPLPHRDASTVPARVARRSTESSRSTRSAGSRSPMSRPTSAVR